MSTMQGTVTPEVQVFDTTDLLPVDVCDSCGAQQARVRVTTRAGILLFCGHDYHKAESGLAAVALHVHDERHKLLPQPYDPATDNS